MTKRFVALYKAWRGGEWFGASLESVAPHTDGAVIVFSDGPWLASLRLPENCQKPLTEFRRRHPDYRIMERTGNFSRQEDQYAAGLAAVREEFGEDAAVLIVDTDEIWGGKQLELLRGTIEAHPHIQYFRSRIWSYLKSPLYRVWPTEDAHTCVALQNARPQPTSGRFAIRAAKSTMRMRLSIFHHFTYVREDELEIGEKFLNTSSQEAVPSRVGWFEEVWPKLPDGRDLHMTPGHERAWGRIKILPPQALPRAVWELPFVQANVAQEAERWRARLAGTRPDNALMPIPTSEDAMMYGDDLDPREDSLVRRQLKMTYLEALWLVWWASELPAGSRILEIGAGSGASAVCLARASRTARLDVVDPFTPYDEETHAGLARNVREGNQTAFWETARHYDFSRAVTHHPCDSREAADRLGDRYALAFVDGNHSYDYVLSDLRLCWQRLRSGGILIGHDYTTRFPGVIRAVANFEDRGPDCEFTTPPGTSLFYARKP